MIHGVIQINHHTICEYEITHEQKFNDNLVMYLFKVSGTENSGKPYKFEWSQVIVVTTAPKLVSIALTEVHKRLVK